MVFSEGLDYNIFQPVAATNNSNVGINMRGNLRLPQNITAIQGLVNETSDTYATALY